MTDLDQILLAARQLGDYGLCRSALRLLDATDAIGRSVNSLRARLRVLSTEPRIPVGIYALGILPEVAVVLPLAVTPGDSRCPLIDDASADACQVARAVLRNHIDPVFGIVPQFSITMPDMLGTSGRSLGLAAALALAKRIGGLALSRPVIASGELASSGAVLPVDGIEEKLSAAEAEIEGTAGLVILPRGQKPPTCENACVREVATLAEALHLVWGRDLLPIDDKLLAVEQLVAASRAERDHRKAAHVLESRPISDLAPPDKARLLTELGTRFRHTGDALRAAALHEQVEALLPEISKVEGRAAVESIRVELIATRVSLFLFDEAETRLRALLAGDFELQHNRVRSQGMLAQVLSTTGRHEEALQLRESNLALQRLTDAMRREIPRTLASLVWEAARADREDIFDVYLMRLLDEAPPQDTEQQRYTDSAVVRGLVRLGRHRTAVDWIDGVTRMCGHAPSASLLDLANGRKPITTHPEVSTARYLVRALRKCGQNGRAVALADRVEVTMTEPLFAWLGALSSLERFLASALYTPGLEIGTYLEEIDRRLQATCSFAPRVAVTPAVANERESAQRLESWLDQVYY